MERERLDKLISSRLCVSRSIARAHIRKGQVTVNGSIIKDAAASIDINSDAVICDGQAVCADKYIYIMMNKPSGVLSASNDKTRKTVVDLVPEYFKRRDLFPVGRLDKDTTGLLIITNDGEFAHNCISPKKKVSKLYRATLDGEVTAEMEKRFLEGVTLADGTLCKSSILRRTGENTADITIIEGRYHQIKRMFGTVGLGVNKLHRKSIGSLVLPDDLLQGECVKLTNEQLKMALYSKECTFSPK